MDLCYSIQELNAKLKKHSILFSAFKPLPGAFACALTVFCLAHPLVV